MFGLFQLDGRPTCSAWGPDSRALGVGHAHLFLSAETNSGRSNLRRAGSAAWSQQELTAKRILLIYQRHGAHVHLFPRSKFFQNPDFQNPRTWVKVGALSAIAGPRRRAAAALHCQRRFAVRPYASWSFRHSHEACSAAARAEPGRRLQIKCCSS